MNLKKDILIYCCLSPDDMEDINVVKGDPIVTYCNYRYHVTAGRTFMTFIELATALLYRTSLLLMKSSTANNFYDIIHGKIYVL